MSEAGGDPLHHRRIDARPGEGPKRVGLNWTRAKVMSSQRVSRWLMDEAGEEVYEIYWEEVRL